MTIKELEEFKDLYQRMLTSKGMSQGYNKADFESKIIVYFPYIIDLAIQKLKDDLEPESEKESEFKYNVNISVQGNVLSTVNYILEDFFKKVSSEEEEKFESITSSSSSKFEFYIS